jgi:cytochrome c peroxidase
MILKSSNEFLRLLIVVCFVLQINISFANSQMAITPIKWPDNITAQMLLGKRLFFDKILSKDKKIACVSCHLFPNGGSVDKSRPIMYSGKMAGHNSTSIFNLSTNYKLGWIGQLSSIEHQFEKLVKGKKVMGLSWEEIVERLRNDASYVKQFNEIYPSKIGGQSVTKKTVSAAVVAYESALITPSPFDRYLLGDQRAISDNAKQGYQLFQRFGCIACHQGKNVGGNLLQKLGVIVPYNPPGSEKHTAHLGRYNLTKRNEDKQVFRVPSLRNVALSGPYLHDGSIQDLQDVIKLMAKHQLGRSISEQDKLLILEFLLSLSGTVHPELLP